MQFKRNATVVLSDGTDAGRLDRVVIDPRTKEVTDLVIRKGLLFTEDKVVPMDMIDTATAEMVKLRAQKADLERLAPYEEIRYVGVLDEIQPAATPPDDDLAAPLYWYPMAAGVSGQPLPVVPVPAVTEAQHNIPTEAVALKEGARVIAADQKHVGNVEQVLADSRTGRATGFVLSRGVLLKERRRVPITWVDQIGEDEVRLLVGSRLIASLGYVPN